MRAEKQNITQEYLRRLNAAPFFIVVEYTGLRVGPITELRRRLRLAGAELHVVKNALFKLAAKEAGLGDLGGILGGQLAVVTGPKDISAAAKALKTFAAEFERPKVRFGGLSQQRLEAADVLRIADLPPRQALQGQLLGVLKAPPTRLVALLSTPASQLARVLKARAEQGAPAA